MMTSKKVFEVGLFIVGQRPFLRQDDARVGDAIGWHLKPHAASGRMINPHVSDPFAVEKSGDMLGLEPAAGNCRGQAVGIHGDGRPGNRITGLACDDWGWTLSLEGDVVLGTGLPGAKRPECLADGTVALTRECLATFRTERALETTAICEPAGRAESSAGIR